MLRPDHVLLAGLLLGVAAPLRGQAPPATPAPVPSAAELQLVYEREIFTYPIENRRDPFTPLTGPEGDGLGPRFEQLTLRGIIFSPTASRSVALLADPNGRIYRIRQGEIVGNAVIVAIEPLRVVFRVESFGAMRQEALELKRPDRRGGQR